MLSSITLFAVLACLYLSTVQAVAPIWSTDFQSCATTVSQDLKDPTRFDDAYYPQGSKNTRLLQCQNVVAYGGSGWAGEFAVPGSSYGTLVKSVPVVSGQSITISFWLRADQGNPSGQSSPEAAWPISRIGITASSGPAISVALQNNPPNNGFYKYTATYIPATTGSVTFTFTVTKVPTNNGIHIAIDNFSIGLTSGGFGDPQFIGMRGQSYQVHGIDGAVYNLVTDTTTQVNSRFTFLNKGKCPIIDGIPARNCWSHPGSYMGEIGMQQIVNGVTHKLAIIAGAYTVGFASVTLDGKELSVGAEFEDTELFNVKYDSTHQITIRTSDFTFVFDNSDKFVNYVAQAMKPLSQLTCHGLLGQTHKNAVYRSTIKYIAGAVDDYVIMENELFGHEFVYNLFDATQ